MKDDESFGETTRFPVLTETRLSLEYNTETDNSRTELNKIHQNEQQNILDKSNHQRDTVYRIILSTNTVQLYINVYSGNKQNMYNRS